MTTTPPPPPRKQTTYSEQLLEYIGALIADGGGGGGGGMAAPTKLFKQYYEQKQFTGHSWAKTSIAQANQMQWNGSCIDPRNGYYFACSDTPGMMPPFKGILAEISPAGVITEYNFEALFPPGYYPEDIAYDSINGCLWVLAYDGANAGLFKENMATSVPGARTWIDMSAFGFIGLMWRGVAMAIDQTAPGTIWVSDFTNNQARGFNYLAPIIIPMAPISLAPGSQPGDVCIDPATGNPYFTMATNATWQVAYVRKIGLTIGWVMGGSQNITQTWSNGLSSRLAYKASANKMYMTGKTASVCTIWELDLSSNTFTGSISLGQTQFCEGLCIHPVTGNIYVTGYNGAWTQSAFFVIKPGTIFNFSNTYYINRPTSWWPGAVAVPPSRGPEFSTFGGTPKLFSISYEGPPPVGGMAVQGYGVYIINATTLYEIILTPTAGKKLHIRGIQAGSTGTTTGNLYFRFDQSAIDVGDLFANGSGSLYGDGSYSEGAINEPLSLLSSNFRYIAWLQISYDEV